MAFQIPLPEKLESKRPEEWQRWIERFECYRIAATLNKNDEAVQVSTLVYAMGGNSMDILKSFEIPEKEIEYRDVVDRFNTHFVGRTNVIFERARFNRRTQKETETVIDFIEDLNKLADSCKFGALKDELIRDRIVVGIHNASLSEKLMNDEKLTLQQAIKKVKASELIKQHQEV